MLRADPRRDLYETCLRGQYQVTYSNGNSPTLNQSQVDDLIRHRLIQLKWPECPQARCYVLAPP